MITNFEEITQELSDKEIVLLEPLVQLFKANQNRFLPSTQIERFLNIRGSRLRKIINLIRTFHVLPVIATTKGYYISWDREEIQKQIQSLNDRADSIRHCAKGLEWFLNNSIAIIRDRAQLDLFNEMKL